MIWSFFSFWCLLYGCVAALAVSIAIAYQRLWMAILICLGLIAGAALSILSVVLSMYLYESMTGYGAGNYGLMFFITIPTFPPFGMFIGAVLGWAIDNRRAKSLYGP